MNRSWKLLLFFQLPVVAVAIALVVQAAAMALANVPLRRNRIDELALAVVKDPTNYPILLFGDSIARNATIRYSVDPVPGSVANITTHAAAGLETGLFLTQRYLETHKPPRYLVVVTSPDVYIWGPEPRQAHYYNWNVFDRPSERAFLKTYFPTIDAQEHYPAILNVQENILERLIGLVRRAPPHLASGARQPDPDPVLEPISGDESNAASIADRLALPLDIGPRQQAVLEQLCALSVRYGFTIALVWAPAPPPLLQAWRQRGDLAHLESRINRITSGTCNVAGPVFNINDVRSYTNFDRRSYHQRGAGWEQRFVLDLRAYIGALPDLTPSLQARAAPAASGVQVK
jgi:hypothetical protein